MTEIKNVNILREFLQKGRSIDLLDLLKGESMYNIDTNEELPLNKDTSKIWRMAISHVEFITKSGIDRTKAEEDSKFYSAHPDDFEKWLEIGAPGITQEEIEMYLEENPL